MSNRWDICTARAGKDGKTFWNKCATMFEGKDGRFNIEFDALPVPTAEQRDDGTITIRTRCVAFPAKPRDQQASGGNAGGGWGDAPELDDQIPY